MFNVKLHYEWCELIFKKKFKRNLSYSSYIGDSDVKIRFKKWDGRDQRCKFRRNFQKSNEISNISAKFEIRLNFGRKSSNEHFTVCEIEKSKFRQISMNKQGRGLGNPHPTQAALPLTATQVTTRQKNQTEQLLTCCHYLNVDWIIQFGWT